MIQDSFNVKTDLAREKDWGEVEETSYGGENLCPSGIYYLL